MRSLSRSMRAAWLALTVVAAMVAPQWGACASDFLDPSVAFKFSARRVDDQTVEVHYDIADGYYLYRERFKFRAEPDSVTLGPPQYPKGEVKFDETFNRDVEHYRRAVTIRIPVRTAQQFTLVATAQGCADAGLCYPPQEARADFAAAALPPSATPSEAARQDGHAPAAPGGELSRIESTLRAGSLVAIAGVFVVLGLILSFTPCVLPMVPILSSIIVGDAGHRYKQSPNHPDTGRTGQWRGFLLALVYALGMALVYTLVGVAAGLAGEGLAALLQKPAVLYAFAALLVILAMSMFGFYELQLPNFLQTLLSRWSYRAGGGRFTGVFVMGALSALIVGPCVAAPLAATLIYISQTRNVLIGAVALFSLAAGMSVPLLIVGASAGALLPKAGAWMESIKHFFGVLLIALAIWMVSPVMAAWVQMLVWAAFLVVLSVYLRAFDALPERASGWARLAKGLGILLFVGGVIQVLGVASGSRDVLQPLANLHAARSGDPLSPPVVFDRIHSVAELDARLQVAKRPVLLDFYADWCVSCKEMDRLTYSDARVAARMKDFILLQADVTQNSDDDRALLKHFNLFGPPGILFFDRAGHPLPEATVIGFENAETFLERLARLGAR